MDETEAIQLVKKQKVKDFAELTRRAEKKPWVSRLWLAPGLIVTGHFLMIGSYAAFVMNMWAFPISLVAGIACYVVGFHDDDIRKAKMWHKKVLEGPSEALKASAARSLRSWSFMAFPAVCAVGLLSVAFAMSFGFFIPDWLMAVWTIAFFVLWLVFVTRFAILGDRRVLGKIEAYRRGIPVYSLEESSYDALTKGMEEPGSDLKYLEEKYPAPGHRDVRVAMELAGKHAETILADGEQPEEARCVAQKVLERVEEYGVNREALLAEKRVRLAIFLLHPDGGVRDGDEIRALIAEITELSKAEAHQPGQEQEKSEIEG